jgi:cytochrome c oxidase subunit 2
VHRPDPIGTAVRRRGRHRLAVAAGLAVMALTLAGCSSEELPRFGLPESATDSGRVVTNLWQGSWIAALVVGGLVWGLIGYTIVFHRRRASHEGTLPTQTRYNLPVEILYTITPLLTVVVLFYFTWRDENTILELEPDPAVTVHVVGQQWSWTFNYVDQDVYTIGTPAEPPTLVLPLGETVEFVLTAHDTIHSMWIPAFLVKLDMLPGDPNFLQVTPDKLGTFAGRCAELCGTYHSRMLFTVEVVPPEDFEAAMAELAAAGQTGQVMPELKDETFGNPGVAPGEGEG